MQEWWPTQESSPALLLQLEEPSEGTLGHSCNRCSNSQGGQNRTRFWIPVEGKDSYRTTHTLHPLPLVLGSTPSTRTHACTHMAVFCPGLPCCLYLCPKLIPPFLSWVPTSSNTLPLPFPFPYATCLISTHSKHTILLACGGSFSLRPSNTSSMCWLKRPYRNLSSSDHFSSLFLIGFSICPPSLEWPS